MQEIAIQGSINQKHFSKLVRNFATQYFPIKIFYPKNATSLIARIAENNEDRNMEHQPQDRHVRPWSSESPVESSSPVQSVARSPV